MTRQQAIARGKMWYVSEDGEDVFEGSRTACLKYISDHGWNRRYKNGQGIRMGQTIWEADPQATLFTFTNH